MSTKGQFVLFENVADVLPASLVNIILVLNLFKAANFSKYLAIFLFFFISDKF